MIFVNYSKNTKAAQSYFEHLSAGDYYHGKDAAEMPGVWHGKGAERLGLCGEVTKDDFFALCENRNPQTGEQLTPRTRIDRRCIIDFTFTAPKSTSLILELGGDDGRGDPRVLKAFQESVRETMAEIEKDAQTRIRKGGSDENRVTGNLVWAEYIHKSARPVDGLPDPSLHCHAVIANATFDSVEGRWKALQLSDVIRDKGYYQAAADSRFAAKLKACGYPIAKDGKTFKIASIEKSTADKFSRRTAIIEAEAERLGIEDSLVKGNLGRRTREKKSDKPLSMSELRKEWNSRLNDDERIAIRTAGSGWEKGDAHITPDQAKTYALEHSFQNASAVSVTRLKAEALMHAVGSVKPEDVADIAQHPEVITRKHDGQFFATTKTVLRDEVAMLQFAKDGQRKQQPFVSKWSPDRYKTGEFVSFDGLSEEQKKAALHIICSRDTVTGIVGKAGTGKTTMMRATRDAIESVPGQHVFAFAPSSQASRNVLAKEGFSDAQTLAMLLKNTKLQEQTKGQVIWIDEAGLVSGNDMRKLFDIAKKNGNRVILSGDYTQHSSIERLDAFRLLEKEAGVKLARLTEIRRQTVSGYKKAVEAISQGSGKAAQKGFAMLDKIGWVVEASGEERHQLLVKDYLKAQEEGRSALIIAPTHAEGDKLTDELRTTLKQRGALGKEHQFVARKSTGWTDAQKGDVRNYEPGMILEWHQNAKGFKRGEKTVVVESENGPQLQKQDGTRAALPAQTDRFDVFRTRNLAIAKGDRIRITKNGEAKVEGQPKGTRVNNGDVFTVEGFTKEGDIRIDKAKVLPKDWGHMSLGYVDTSYSSQGKTVDRVFIATGNESLPAANQQQWYVSTSRGREMAKIYVDSKEDVRDAIARTGQRLSAVELTKTKLRPSWRDRFQQTLERNRVGRFLKTRAEAIADHWRRREGIRYA
ncbi:MAG TPA: MobF family relaxase [Bryobacteraceae bacterium]|jgi:conjugative relaxase-like TrwC/TraI family protein|nr:MobF family relaxase [Bryobacteraceae bacterium]